MALKTELMASSLPTAAASKLGFDAVANITATGGSQGAAAPLVSNFSIANAGSGAGVILTRTHEMFAVINTSGGNVTVYPQVGGQINGAAANAGLVVGTGKQAIFIPCGLNWVGILSA